jgi:hypothetical protein
VGRIGAASIKMKVRLCVDAKGVRLTRQAAGDRCLVETEALE